MLYDFIPDSITAALTTIDEVSSSLFDISNTFADCLVSAKNFISLVASLTDTSMETSVTFSDTSQLYREKLGNISNLLLDFQNTNIYASEAVGKRLNDISGDLYGINPMNFDVNSTASIVYGVNNVLNYKTYKYLPQVKNGEIDTNIYSPERGHELYSGEYIEYKNDDGLIIRSPLAIAKYENDKVIFIPMTEEEKKNYIERITKFYNEISVDLKNGPQKYKDEIIDRVDSYTINYLDTETAGDIVHALAYTLSTSDSNHSDISIFAQNYFDINESNDYSAQQIDDLQLDSMLEGFIHESGHAYANNKIDNNFFSNTDRDDTNSWNEIYNQVCSDDVNRHVIFDYAFSTKGELFAQATKYYVYDPDRLKMIDIDIDGYDTLYDYMDYILNY